ncbi:hypothetical protein [Paenibacillus agricola]|uniref:Uncharacterized protein n=1 Tax=Paenibacillus agricola TaxID=2716264 RepID=A0ABX0IZL1_9BACL|nr:hypothetical protein [Paenibacillus agricola]NHN29420.1 hypothetical protein [Paenibacillus agricola]
MCWFVCDMINPITNRLIGAAAALIKRFFYVRSCPDLYETIKDLLKWLIIHKRQ